jgi:hypothetical protein
MCESLSPEMPGPISDLAAWCNESAKPSSLNAGPNGFRTGGVVQTITLSSRKPGPGPYGLVERRNAWAAPSYLTRTGEESCGL